MIATLHPVSRAFFCLLVEYAKLESKQGEGRNFDDTGAKNLSGACHGVSVKRGVGAGVGVGVYFFFFKNTVLGLVLGLTLTLTLTQKLQKMWLLRLSWLSQRHYHHANFTMVNLDVMDSIDIISSVRLSH